MIVLSALESTCNIYMPLFEAAKLYLFRYDRGLCNILEATEFLSRIKIGNRYGLRKSVSFISTQLRDADMVE